MRNQQNMDKTYGIKPSVTDYWPNFNATDT